MHQYSQMCNWRTYALLYLELEQELLRNCLSVDICGLYMLLRLSLCGYHTSLTNVCAWTATGLKSLPCRPLLCCASLAPPLFRTPACCECAPTAFAATTRAGTCSVALSGLALLASAGGSGLSACTDLKAVSIFSPSQAPCEHPSPANASCCVHLCPTAGRLHDNSCHRCPVS
jgi:hypothetical protein